MNTVPFFPSFHRELSGSSDSTRANDYTVATTVLLHEGYAFLLPNSVVLYSDAEYFPEY